MPEKESAYYCSGELTKALEAYCQCMSGNYAPVAANHVKKLGKKQRKRSKTLKGLASVAE